MSTSVSSGRRQGGRLVAAVLVLVFFVAGCGSDGGDERHRVGPAFHSAGPEARAELQELLQDQADLIAAGDWTRYFELYVPTERERCSAEVFGIFADQTWSQLREQAKDQTLAARVVDVQVNGFQAAVNYQLIVRESDLATPLSTESYLKLGDRWFIDEQAC